MVALTPDQAAALAAIRAAWPDVAMILIGAQAIGCHIDMTYRETDDLDLAIGIAIGAFPGPLASSPGWRRDSRQNQRFHSPAGVVVDIIPAGPELVAAGHLDWPSGHRMSLIGFDLAFEHCDEHDAGHGTTVHVPSAGALVFLKLRAWLDRPEERRKDLRDLAHLLDGELGAILRPLHQPHVREFLARVRPEQLAAHGPASWYTVELVEKALAAFRRGLGRS
jgi:predicted nucleotidyltransferase